MEMEIHIGFASSLCIEVYLLVFVTEKQDYQDSAGTITARRDEEQEQLKKDVCVHHVALCLACA